MRCNRGIFLDLVDRNQVEMRAILEDMLVKDIKVRCLAGNRQCWFVKLTSFRISYFMQAQLLSHLQ